MANKAFWFGLAAALVALTPAPGGAEQNDQIATARAAIDNALRNSGDENAIVRALQAEGALTVWPTELEPAYGEHAWIHAVLLSMQGQAIVYRPDSTIADIERAIPILQQATALLPDQYIEARIRNLNALALAYGRHPSGNAAQDDRVALSAYEDAYAISNQLTSEEQRAQVEIALARYSSYVAPNDEGVRNRAMDLYIAALARLSGNDRQWFLRASTSDTLGFLYYQRERAGELDRSIAMYEQALALYNAHQEGAAYVPAVHLHLAYTYFWRAGQEAGPDTDRAIAECELARAATSPSNNRSTWMAATAQEIEAINANVSSTTLERALPLAIEVMDAWAPGDDPQILADVTGAGAYALLVEHGSGIENAQRAAAYLDRAIAATAGHISNDSQRALAGLRDQAHFNAERAPATAGVPAVNSCDDALALVTYWLRVSSPNESRTGPEFPGAVRRAITLCEAKPADPSGDGGRLFALSYMNLLLAASGIDDATLLDRALDYAQQALVAADIRSSPTAVGQLRYLIAYIAATRAGYGSDPRLAALARDSANQAIATASLDDRQGIIVLALSAAANTELGDLVAAQANIDAGATAVSRVIGAGLNEREILSIQRPARLLFDIAAALALKRNDPTAALGYMERSRAQVLNASLRADETQLSAPDRDALALVRADIRRREAALAATDHPSTRDLDAVRDVRQQAAAILARSPAVAELTPSTPVIAPLFSDFGSAILVRAGGGVRSLALDAPSAALLREALAAWKAGYTEAALPHAIDDFRARFESTLGVSLRRALTEAGIAPGARIALMPDGGTSLLPILLLRDVNSGHTLIDDYVVTLTPSLHALAIAERRANEPADSLVAFWNETLPMARAEASLAGAQFAAGQSSTLGAADITSPQDALTALRRGGYWHFATHGAFNWERPTQSGLALSPTTTLTLADLQQSGQVLSHPRLIILSACESGLSDVDRDPNEFIGLPAAFLQSGGAGVIASLWPVADGPTALLFAQFYKLHRGQHLAAPEALRRAQLWLRDASRDDLTQFVDAAAAADQIDAVAADALQGAIADAQGDMPFSSPIYWGAWVYYGA